MAESIEVRENVIELDEETEGNSVGSSDFIFRKIGEPVPLKPTNCEFDLKNAPVQALAVSEQSRLVFLAHTEGFCVVKTKDVIELAKAIKEKENGSRSIQELSIVDIQIGRVSILALSTDSSTLAACVGGEILFFSVTSLLNKEKEPSFSCSVSESDDVKDLRWSKNVKNSFVVLSSHGMLYHGDLGGLLKDVMDTVDAVDWSVKGDYIAVARRNTLCILSSEFKEQFRMSLLFKSWADDLDEKCIIKVDSINWVRSDSITIGCFILTEDGNENGYLLQVITNNDGEITEASKPVVLSFSELFSCIVDDIVPFGRGPYLYANYLEHWELMLAANRKSTDQHIVLLGWSGGDKRGEAVAVEFKHDKEVPRIELPESGDDNLIVGFGIDRVSLYEKVKYVRDAEHRELSPYCILLCLTTDGKLIMFHVARISDIAVLPQTSSAPCSDITGGAEDSASVVRMGSVIKDHGTDAVVMDGKSSQMNKSDVILQENALEVSDLKVLDSKLRQTSEELNRYDGILKENASQFIQQKESLRSSSVVDQMFAIKRSESVTTSGSASHDSSSVAANKDLKSLGNIQASEVDAQLNGHPARQKQDSATAGVNVGLSGQEISNLEQPPVESPLLEGFSSAIKDSTKTGTQKLDSTPIRTGMTASSLAGNLPSDTSATWQQSYKGSLKSNEVGKGLTEMTGSTGVRSILSGSQSSGKLSNSNDLNTRSSSFASGVSAQSDANKGFGIWTGNNKHIPANQSFPSIVQPSTKIVSSKSSETTPSSSIFSSGKATQSEGRRTAWTGAGNAESTTLIHSFPSSSQEDSMLGKSLGSKGNHMLTYQRTNRSPGALDSEQELSKSYINVIEMTKELDALLSDIEKEGGFRDACTLFQKKSVLELEEGLESLSERCRVWKKTLDERLGDIQHLRDKTVQVLARKVYMEGVVKQASNMQYWELWNHQKLNPEFELKRQQILKINQNLMTQIIELGRHFNALEFNKFGDNNSVSMRRRTVSSSEPSRQIQSLHSLYNTMNLQLAAAEQLSDCLSKQMAVLNIESPPVKKQNVAKELFESIGLAYDGDGFQSPDVQKATRSPESIKKLPFSSFSAIKEQSRKNTSSAMKCVEPETARRRRDSLDRSWASFEPQKTTVKRMLLEERSRVSKNKSSLGITKQAFNSQLEDGFSVLRQKDHTTLSSSSLQASINKQQSNIYLSSKGIQGKPSTQASESPSVTLFKWSKDSTGALDAGGLKSPSMQVMQRGNPQVLSSASASSPLSTVRNNTEENLGSAERSSFGATRIGQFYPSSIQAVSISETTSSVQSETPTPEQTASRSVSAVVSTKNGSPKKAAHVKAKASELSNLNRGENVQTKQTTGSMKHGAVIPESPYAAPEKVHTSPFASVSVIPPSAGLRGKTFQFDTPMSRTQSGDTTSVATFSSLFSLSTPASAPPIRLSSSLNTVSAAPLTSPNPVSAAPSSSPNLVSTAPLTFPNSVLAAPSSSPNLVSTTSFTYPNPVLAAPSSSPNIVSSVPSSLPAMPFRGQFPSTRPSMDTNKTVPSSSSSSSSSTFSFQWQKPQVPSAIQSPSEDSALQAPPSQPKAADGENSSSSGPAQSLSPAAEVSSGSSSGGQPSSSTTTNTFNNFGAASRVSLNSQPENPSAEHVLLPTPSSTPAEGKNEGTDVTITQEDEMDEEALDTTTELCLGSLGGFGIGSSPVSNASKPNSFGAPFGSAATNPTSSPFSWTVPSGELFRPASLSFPSSTPQSSQPMNQGAFFGGFGNMATSPLPMGSGFGQPVQIGAGQQALGSVLGAFGQSRQLGPGLPGVGFASSSGFNGDGFSAAAKSGSPVSGSGFATVASTVGGFAGVASKGGGFAAVASGSGGFAAAAGGGGGGGFAGAASGGFGAFSNPQGSGGFSAFGGSNAMGTGKPPELFTRMRR